MNINFFHSLLSFKTVETNSSEFTVAHSVQAVIMNKNLSDRRTFVSCGQIALNVSTRLSGDTS